jgi:hypothetical protein
MRPRELVNEGIFRVLLRNQLPTMQTVNLGVETPRGGLYVDAARKQISLTPGQRGVVDFYIQAMRRPIVGRSGSLPYVVRVMHHSKEPAEGMNGEMLIKPQIPLWLGMLLLALVLTLCGLSAWWLNSLPLLGGLLAG